MEERTVLPPKAGAGPHGVGDPDDRSLRRVEIEVKIPQIMRDRARKEKCLTEDRAFAACAKANGLLMVFKCRKESRELKDCMTRWYEDPVYKKECTEEYLEERRIYRLTGKKAPMKRKEMEMF